MTEDWTGGSRVLDVSGNCVVVLAEVLLDLREIEDVCETELRLCTGRFLRIVICKDLISVLVHCWKRCGAGSVFILHRESRVGDIAKQNLSWRVGGWIPGTICDPG